MAPEPWMYLLVLDILITIISVIKTVGKGFILEAKCKFRD
jgi:hypothetical protein